MSIPLEGTDNPVAAAAAGGHMECLKALVEAGAGVDPPRGLAVLKAVEGGHCDAAKYLVEHGADLHQGKRGWGSRVTKTPALAAAKSKKSQAEIYFLTNYFLRW